VALATDHGAHVDEVAERAIDLFERHVRTGNDEPPTESPSPQELVDVVRSLLPAVTRLVAQHFHRTLVARARDRAGAGDEEAGLIEALLAADADRLEVDVRWR